MFLRAKIRRKDGKDHRTWSIVENRRSSGGRVVQRHVLYLGEINDSQQAAWCKTIDALDHGGTRPRQVALFLETMAAIQMVDVELPTADGRTLTLSRYTEPEPAQKLLIQQLKLSLPDQPPPRIAPGTQAQM
jgi:hypothetical protein